jgi:hypothetical protein
MPTTPVFPNTSPYDPRKEKIKLAYGDYIRDTPRVGPNPDMFPLDIRRVFKVDPRTGKPLANKLKL